VVAVVTALVAASLADRRVSAAEAGDVVQANNIGVPLYTYNFDKGSGTSITDKSYLSELMGAHWAGPRGSRVRLEVDRLLIDERGG
jgi:hypothetical protein